MLFYSFFKSLVGKEVTVELKNDLGITGHLHSVDQYLNIKLQDIYVTCPGNGLNTKERRSSSWTRLYSPTQCKNITPVEYVTYYMF